MDGNSFVSEGWVLGGGEGSDRQLWTMGGGGGSIERRQTADCRHLQLFASSSVVEPSVSTLRYPSWKPLPPPPPRGET